jgi:hypothetical protein
MQDFGSLTKKYKANRNSCILLQNNHGSQNKKLDFVLRELCNERIMSMLKSGNALDFRQPLEELGSNLALHVISTAIVF